MLLNLPVTSAARTNGWQRYRGFPSEPELELGPVDVFVVAI